ncbi:putative metallocarboxypeptidase ecm14 [Exophiala xenobiotica]|nr:putative metallocarboxypeptidase ecm14 [Exophiala xenobiotica]KAK5397913.1 putative metallocarboxypeptidase ecm14 [Exophiala xenobiotica]KAK5418018.1 putative metallocarboxypeptidase ecm14 [Exophiala xenobiotica]KAK5464475.1 putative metallocarboxypeptidase ecm14 [Exophiala xenobiotica]KAK5498235.1 putative metallocarboxypeptidase ecm14 [Exophiala xenobiotica]
MSKSKFHNVVDMDVIGTGRFEARQRPQVRMPNRGTLWLLRKDRRVTLPPIEPQSHASLRPQTSYSAKVRSTRPFSRLRDIIIEKIWSIPGKNTHKGCSSSQPLPQLPRSFHARYGNDVVLRFGVRTEDEAKALSEATSMLYLDIWEATDDWVDIRIAKDVVPSFIGLLPTSLHHAYRPLMHDLARAVYDTYPTLSSDQSPLLSTLITAHGGRTHLGTPQDLFFQDYQPLSVLYPWLRLVASMFPAHAELLTIGQSAEGRDIHALRLGAKSQPGDPHDERHTLLVVGGTHAREWISISTTAYVAYSLATQYGHPHFHAVTKLLDHFDIVFVPVLNPDGYEYTWTTDRLWRKNRQSTSLPFCPGIDLDRSFRFEWDGHGSADNACSDDYAGPAPLIAREAQVLTEWARNETQTNNTTFVSYLDLHSYSQEVLYPYSYTCDIDPPNLEDLEEVALGLAKSFRLTNGHYYAVESACRGSITYQDKGGKVKKTRTRVQPESQGGSALDFFYHDLDVKLAFQIKLRDTGTYGFLLPKSNILPTGEEAYEAVMALGRWLLGNHGIESVDPNSDPVWGVEKTSEVTVEEILGGSGSEIDEYEENNEGYEDGWDVELRRRRRRR